MIFFLLLITSHCPFLCYGPGPAPNLVPVPGSGLGPIIFLVPALSPVPSYVCSAFNPSVSGRNGGFLAYVHPRSLQAEAASLRWLEEQEEAGGRSRREEGGGIGAHRLSLPTRAHQASRHLEQT